jgi:hypothetical protein
VLISEPLLAGFAGQPFSTQQQGFIDVFPKTKLLFLILKKKIGSHSLD